MTRNELSNLDRLGVFDDAGKLLFWGHDQEWYGSWWRRMAGCGPTTASNLMRYAAAAEGPAGTWRMADALSLMDAIWKYITPRRGGVNSTGLLRDGALRYAKAEGMRLSVETLDVPEDEKNRPDLQTAVAFIADGLKRDEPVAFLNLDNGAEKQLDKWHWVTIIAIEYAEDRSEAGVDILDNCKTLRVNVGRWMATTRKGGGFVRFVFGGEDSAS
jgi:hypothetical protein